jgi:predicted DNA-binding antitoxin AbrB/MazE fold protein
MKTKPRKTVNLYPGEDIKLVSENKKKSYRLMKYLLQNKGQKAKINLEMGVGKLYITGITTVPKFRLYGFSFQIYWFPYIRAAGGLLHKSQGLSLFLDAFRFFYAPTWISSLQNNDK